MSCVVRLHIGAPKTGTTYVQDRLTLNSASLGRHGVTIPTKNRFVPADLFQFRAALDLLGQDWGGPAGHAEGAWETLLRRIERTEGSAIVSHEILAPAKPDRVAQALSDLSRTAEVHVVYSARDLARQLPAAWQESIKQGRKWTFRRFLDRAESGKTWFYRAFDLPSVLGRWGADLPPERVHLVTVPPRSAPRDPEGNLLWARMCAALGVDPSWAPRDTDRANPSLGAAETQVVRQLNRRMARKVRRDPRYDEMVLQVLAHRELAQRGSRRGAASGEGASIRRPASIPVRLPPDRFDWAEAETQRWIDWVGQSGIQVVGDLEDLRPRRPDADDQWQDPDRVPVKLRYQSAVDALAAMTHEASGRVAADRTLTGRLRSGAKLIRPR